MYSNNQWSFNPAVYQNIPYEQVDWASLAQQWIKMKETVPATTQGPAPPPAPVISKTAETPVPTPTLVPSQPSNDIEGGEAPMDMDTKDDETTTPPVGAAVTSGNWNQWGNWQSQWGWGWSGNSGSVTSTDSSPSATSNVDSKVKSTNNDSIAALNDVRNFPLVGNSTTTQVSSTFNYNNTGGTVIPPIIPKSNYGFNNTFPPSSKHSSDNWHKGGKSSNRQAPQKSIPPEQFPVLDAAKKKQLPAWIRDGLTKMEREKQKKMERERMVQEKYIMDQIKSEHVEPEPAPMPVYIEEPQPRDPPPAMPDYARRFSPDPAPASKFQKRRSPSIPRQRSREPQALRKTKDQIMEESMLKVRRILTEILLEATEKQVHLIAKEEHRRYRPSASAPQIRKSNALTSLTGNLGLDVYDSEDNSSDGERDRDDDIDSDEELKMTIEKKKRDFTLVEDEIERLIEDQEARERLISQRDAKDEDDIDDDGNEDDEEDEPRARNSRDKDTGEPYHQRYPDHDRERQYSGVESRSVDDDRNDYRSGRRNPAIGGETKQINGDSKLGPTSSVPTGPSGPTTTLVEDPERSKKDSSASSSSSGARQPSRSHHSTKRSSHRSRSSSSSSSSSTSSSSSSSAGGASKSSSGDDDDSASGGEAGTADESKRGKRKKNRKSRRSDTTDKSSSKRSKRRSSEDSDSGSRKSSSRSRYNDGKSSSSSGKRTSSRNTGSDDRSRRRRSPSYRRRSPSYHRSSRREHSSKYKDSPSSSRSRRRGDDYSPESKRSRYRSSSRESSRYKRR